jgi:DNA-binding transcriptional MerR regulator
MYTIGRLATRAKINADSIRFYERQGILSPATKTDSGYRLYTDDAVRRIAFVKRAQQCGFSLAEIRELLHMYSGDPSARRNGYSLAAQKHEEIQQMLEALHEMSEALSCLLKSRADDASRGPVELEATPLFAVLQGGKARDGAEDNAAHKAEHVDRERCVTA